MLYESIDGISSVLVPACIIAFCLLLGADTRSRSVNTLRAAFVSLVTIDLFVGTIGGFSVGDYIHNIVLDFAGAFILGVIAPYFVQMAVPLPEAIELKCSPVVVRQWAVAEDETTVEALASKKWSDNQDALGSVLLNKPSVHADLARCTDVEIIGDVVNLGFDHT